MSEKESMELPRKACRCAPKQNLRGSFSRTYQSGKEISDLLLSRMTNTEIARLLDISEETDKCHVTGIFSKHNITRRSRLAAAMQ